MTHRLVPRILGPPTNAARAEFVARGIGGCSATWLTVDRKEDLATFRKKKRPLGRRAHGIELSVDGGFGQV